MEEEEEVNINEDLDRWGCTFWYDKYHPVEVKRDKNKDTSPFMTLQLKKCSVHDYKHCAEVSAEERERLKDAKNWKIDDFDLTLWGNRGSGRAQLVGYRRRKAVRDTRTDSLSICRVVQNQKLVSFVIKNSSRCARCIPYTQITVTEKGDGCFADPERLTHWLSVEKLKKISKESEEERKRLPMIDLMELKFWGEFGMHWRSGSRYELKSKIKERSIVKGEKSDESLNITVD